MSQEKSLPNNKKALFDPNNVPPGGTCLSSFLAITSNGNDILVGKMNKPEIWTERFFVGEKFAPTYASSGKYVIPASHLAWYESPLDAAYRVLTQQAQISANKENVRVIDAQSPQGRSKRSRSASALGHLFSLRTKITRRSCQSTRVVSRFAICPTRSTKA